MRAYQRVRITTASPAELLILFCEGLVRFTQGAAEALDEERWSEAGTCFTNANEILGHLRESLDEAVAPDLVASLDRAYTAWAMCLVRAQVARDADKVRELVPQMLDLLDSWRTVAHLQPTAVAS